MGMFDDLRCDVPLPDGAVPPGTWFQTKDFDRQLDDYAITEGGRLVKLGPRDGDQVTDMNWHGPVNFYTFGPDNAWCEYDAKFTDGQLVEIVVTEPNRAPPPSPCGEEGG